MRGCAAAVAMDVAPYRLSGRVYAALLNHRSALAALGSAVDAAPYGRAPKAPVLHVKPRNTLAANGAAVGVPLGVASLELGATLGLVIGRSACRVTQDAALEHVAGYLIVNDISIPHDGYYRPGVRFRARDGFCPLGPRVTPRRAISNPDALQIQVYIDGQLRQTSSTSELLRSASRLLSDVTEFMTLSPGDVLAVGAASPAPRAHAGQTVAVEIEGLGRLENPLSGEGE